MSDLDLKEYIIEYIKGNDKKSVKTSLKLSDDDEDSQYVYDEESFKYGLVQYLNKRLNKNYKSEKFMIQCERNISQFKNHSKIAFVIKMPKHEIDIVVIDNTDKVNKKYCLIELKYHKHERGKYPNTMFDCVNDIDFVYKMVNDKNSKFIKGYCVTLVEDDTFYNETNNISLDNYLYQNYWCFRDIDEKKENHCLVRKCNKETNKMDNDEYWEMKKSNEYVDIENYKNKYLPIRKQERNCENTSRWIKIFDDNEIGDCINKKNKNAMFYIVEINREN